MILIILFGVLIIAGSVLWHRNMHKNRSYSKNNPLMLLKEQYMQGEIDQQEYKEKCAL